MSYKGTYNGKTLKHYRTKGSRNGYSKDPNYTPIGEKAQLQVKPSDVEFHPRSTQKDFDTVTNKTRAQLATTGPTTPLGHQVALNRIIDKNIVQSNAKYEPNVRNSAVNAGMAAKGQAASRRVGQANAIRSNQKATEQRRIAGGNGKTATQNNQSTAEQRRIQGSAMPKTTSYYRKQTEDRRIQGRSMLRDKYLNENTALNKARKESAVRNNRSDIGNAVADAKSDAKRLIKKGQKKVRNLLRKFF